jgi:hypothetical protein
MTGQDIINKFHECIDDMSRMSLDSEIRLLNRAYDIILEKKEWGFDVAMATGTINGQVALPNDYRYFTASDGFQYIVVNGGKVSVVAYDESLDISLCAYITGNNLNVKGVNGQYSFFYHKLPTYFTIANYTTETPILPTRYHDALSFQMAVEFYPIDGTEQQANQMETYKKMLDESIYAMYNSQQRNKGVC